MPANEAAQAELAAQGQILPIHSSNHPRYDFEALGKIIEEEEIYYKRTPPTPTQARAIFAKVAKSMEGRIRAGAWMPKLR